MPAPPSTKQKAANQAAMNASKTKAANAGGTMSGVRSSALSSSKTAGGTMSGVRGGVTTRIGGGLLSGGGQPTGILGNPSPLMQKAMDRNRANLLGQQYSQYRSPSPMAGAEDLSRAGFMADQYGQYRSPPAVNPIAPQAPMNRDQMDARINAVSRGPGSVAGVMPGAGPLSQQRTLLGLSGAMSEGGIPISPRDLQRLSATVAGEAGNQGPMGQTAVGNTMLNRMALADQGKGKYMGGGDIDSLMSQYDATGMRKNTTPNRSFRNAQLGTDSLGEGIASIAGAASPNSRFNTTAPDNIRNATHFLTRDAQLAQSRRPPGPSNWSNDPNRPFTAMGAHLFGNAEPIGQQVATARGQPAPPTQVAGLSPASAPPTQQTSETAPSFWQSIGDAGQAAYNAVDENLIQPTKEQIAKYGGLPNALRLSGLAVSIMDFLPGGKVDNSRYTDRTTEGIKNNQNAGAAPLAVAPVVPPATLPAMPPLPPQYYPQYSQMWADLPTGRV